MLLKLSRKDAHTIHTKFGKFSNIILMKIFDYILSTIANILHKDGVIVMVDKEEPLTITIR